MNTPLHSTKVMQVIETVVSTGEGTEKNPNRFVTQYWTLDGKLLAQYDHYLKDKE